MVYYSQYTTYVSRALCALLPDGVPVSCGGWSVLLLVHHALVQITGWYAENAWKEANTHYNGEEADALLALHALATRAIDGTNIDLHGVWVGWFNVEG